MTDNESKAAADLRKEVEENSRILESKQNQLVSIMRGTKSDSGERKIEPYQLEQIHNLEAECVRLTDVVNSLKFDYIQAKTEEDLERRSGEVMTHAAIFSNEDGKASEAPATKFTRMPEGLGEALVNSEAYKRFVHGSRGQMAHVDVPALNMREYAIKSAMKATLGSTGLTSYERIPGVLELGQQPLTVADLLGQAETAGTTVRYLKENTFTNAAAMVAEGGSKPEATWDLSEVDAPVRKIAWMARVTDELFQDYPATRDYINDRMPFGVRQKEELQILSGDGTGQNLTGILSTSGVLTQAKGVYNNIDAIYLGITKVRTQGFWEPDGVVIDPTNWSPIRLLKSTTGEYVYGDPSMPGPETIFGKRVVVTVNMVDNTALVGAFKLGATIFYRQGIRIEATNSDASDFQFNRIALRAEQRQALAVWRPVAFCQVTGLDAA